MKNNNYPLDSVSISLVSSSQFKMAPGSKSATQVIGNLGRGSTETVSWSVIFHVANDTCDATAASGDAAVGATLM